MCFLFTFRTIHRTFLNKNILFFEHRITQVERVMLREPISYYIVKVVQIALGSVGYLSCAIKLRFGDAEKKRL